MTLSTPPAEIQIDANLVRNLLQAQCPQWADLDIRFLGAGWDNENYRLGDQYIVRLPRRAVAVPLMQSEINCLPRLPQPLPISVPVPAYIGHSDQHFPWPWTVLPWFEGTNASYALPHASEALRLAVFLRHLHTFGNIEDAPHNPHRSEPLRLRDEAIKTRMARLKTKTPLLTPAIESLWETAIHTPFPSEMHLVHGDLHSGNVVIHENRIQAIVDWGDITTGDVAVDLAIFWMLFPEKPTRTEALQAYGASDDLIKRAIGWAVYYGVVLLDTGWEGNAEHASVGRALLACLAQEALLTD